jgi:hypothetical protein
LGFRTVRKRSAAGGVDAAGDGAGEGAGGEFAEARDE